MCVDLPVGGAQQELPAEDQAQMGQIQVLGCRAAGSGLRVGQEVLQHPDLRMRRVACGEGKALAGRPTSSAP